MLDFIRTKSKGVFAWIIVIAVALAFAATAITFVGNDRNLAATVAGTKVSWQEIDLLLQRTAAARGLQDLTQLAPEQLQQIRSETREALVQRYANLAAYKGHGYRVDNLQVASILSQAKVLQQDGKFNKELYQRMLQQLQQSDAAYRASLQENILLMQPYHGVLSSSFILAEELQKVVSLRQQTRDISYAKIAANKYRNKVKLSPEDTQAYYDSHKSQYLAAEAVNIEYLQLNLAQLMQRIEPNEAELQKFYKKNTSIFGSPAMVSARHILLENKDQALIALTKLKQGEDFAAVAKALSKDPGSARLGGALGWFAAGDMLPEFSKAAFALKNINDISAPVKSQYGYHLIQLVDKKTAQTQPFTKVKNLVIAKIKREQAELKLATQLQQLEKLTFENMDNLDVASKTMRLKKRVAKLKRYDNNVLAIATPEVLAAAFSDALLQQQSNSAVIKVTPEHYVVLRVTQHNAPRQLEFSEVVATIKEQLITDKSRQLAKATADALLNNLQRHKDAVHIKILARGDRRVSPVIIKTAFTTTEKTSAVVAMPNGNYVVLRVNNVNKPLLRTLEPHIMAKYKQQLQEFIGKNEFTAYNYSLLASVKYKLF
ncbi:MAG: hypothetical protein COC15_05165 [Legionellales bacterium]|nr:MAG: hypothetical protein COC15_05165 [Legionellales bacterium]